jgi:hypothetical protein
VSTTGVVDIVIAIAVLGWVVVRQVQPRPVSVRGLLLLPIILVVIGVSEVSKALPHGQHFTSSDGTWLAVDLAIGVVSGVVRAFTVRLFERDGVLWRQGSYWTIALWVLSVAARVVIGVLGSHHGAGKVLDDGLLLSFGVSLLAQYGVVGWRAQQTGIAFALDARRSRREGY